MDNSTKKELELEKFEIDRLIILDPKALKFLKDESDFISLEFNGEKYFNVRLTRLILKDYVYKRSV